MRYLLVCFFVLVAIPAFAGTAVLNWKDNSANEQGFRIEREAAACTAPDAFAEVVVVDTNMTTYTDPTVVEGVEYCYRVRAYNTAGNSAYSNKAGKQIPFVIPVAPSDLTVTVAP